MSAFHAFPAYPRHRQPLKRMRNGLLKALARLQPDTDPLASSASSLTYLRTQAHTPHTSFATATSAMMMPLSNDSGVLHRTQNLSHHPFDRRTATSAGPITPAVVPGSRRQHACNMLCLWGRGGGLTETDVVTLA